MFFLYNGFMVVAALLAMASYAAQHEVTRFDFLRGRPIVEHWLDYQRDPTHDWSGTIQLFRWKGDWVQTKSIAPREIRSRFRQVEVWPKDTASLFFFGGADLRISWGIFGDSIGLYRDFKVEPQQVTDLYSQSKRLKGKALRGWISAIVFHDQSDLR